MNADDDNAKSDGDLDREIRAALVVDDDPRAVERLRQYWHVQSWKDRWQRRAYFVMTVAAAAVVLIALLMVVKTGRENAKTASVSPAPIPIQADEVPVEAVSTGDAEIEAGARLAGRAPTEFERFIFIARTGRTTPPLTENRSDAARRRAHADPKEMLAGIEQTGGIHGIVLAARQGSDPRLRDIAIARLIEIGSEEALLGYLTLVSDRRTRGAALAVAARGDGGGAGGAGTSGGPPVATWLAFLDHEDKVVRRSAALVLGHVNGPEVTQALIARVMEKPAGATEAWMALLECRGAMAEKFVSYAASRPQLLGHLNGARVQMAYRTP
jgi:hypothetical protein